MPEEKKPLPPDLGPQVDRAEELQKVWCVETGQVWRCGDHFVICGDCREPETWQELLGAAGVEKVNGVFTSPPYAEQRKQQYGGVPVDQYVEWWEAVQQNVRDNLAEDGSFFVNIKPHCDAGQRVLYVFDLVLAMVRRWGWRFVDELCWKKQGTPIEAIYTLKNSFEPVFHFSLSPVKLDKNRIRQNVGIQDREIPVGKTVNRLSQWGNVTIDKEISIGVALPSNVIEANHGNTHKDSGAVHAAAYPVKLPEFFMLVYSDTCDVWCDPFLGSGTTVVAAHNNGRRGIGIEKLERYVAVCLQRFQDAFGVEPVLAG